MLYPLSYEGVAAQIPDSSGGFVFVILLGSFLAVNGFDEPGNQ